MPAISFSSSPRSKPLPACARISPSMTRSLVALRLQAADEPGAGVRQALVVEVDRVLGREHDAEAEGARLLHERQHRQLRGRHRRRREVAEDLVHVEERAQRRGAGLAAHPGDQLVGDQRHDEHALRVGEVRDRDDGDARLALGREQQSLDVERLALEPHAEAGRGEQVVHRHRELEAVLGRDRRSRRRTRRPCRRAASGSRRSGPRDRARCPGSRPHRRSRTAGCARGSSAGSAAMPTSPSRPATAAEMRSRVATRIAAFGRRRERAQDRERQARRAARRVDRDVRRNRGSGGCARRPGPIRRVRSSRSRRSSRRAPLASCPCAPASAGIDPRLELGGREAGEGQHQVRDVALGVDHERRDAVERGLLEERDAKARSCRCRSCRRRRRGSSGPASRTSAARRRARPWRRRSRGRGRTRPVFRSRPRPRLYAAEFRATLPGHEHVNTVVPQCSSRLSPPSGGPTLAAAEAGRNRPRMRPPTPSSSGPSTSACCSTRPPRRRWASRPAMTAGRTPPRQATASGSRSAERQLAELRKFDPAKLDDRHAAVLAGVRGERGAAHRPLSVAQPRLSL